MQKQRMTCQPKIINNKRVLNNYGDVMKEVIYENVE